MTVTLSTIYYKYNIFGQLNFLFKKKLNPLVLYYPNNSNRIWVFDITLINNNNTTMN